ncbi:MAG TPA: tRNA pseudouridine(55) synthase TruB [Burkholderiaceae bacterium]|nr:tRNA pseudouridine(55) synthase TruB [Burkholderiaceae bacterium]
MGRSRGERVDGVLLLDKPAGMTSNRALQKARFLLGARKAGHTGTLDPMADGLLPVTLGEATKFSADLLEADKSYRATLKLGVTTTTGDAEGEATQHAPVAVTDAMIEAALQRFVGAIWQVPPMHSALKRDGRPLYEFARAGIEVERAPRSITIGRLQCVGRQGDDLTLEVDCSKGTYVRVLAADIGAALECGAHLTALRRTRVGALRVEDAASLPALEAMSLEQRRSALGAVDDLLASLRRIDLDETLAGRFRQGQRLAIDAEPRGRVRVYAPNDELLGTANVGEWGVVAPERLISNEKALS